MKESPNLSYLAQFSRGDKSFEEKMISIVKSEFPEEKKVYHANLEEKSYKLASDNVHKIKHKISLFGLEKSHVVATNHENNLREGNIALASDFEEIMQTITDYLETL
jgi:HPt (histidine-containing phosphotransfer) domain-containing protein